MTILLDTHALIWFLDDDPRLPIPIKNQINYSLSIVSQDLQMDAYRVNRLWT
jgi:PIN domain nuclease of toxin-antitoxin system